MTDPGMQATRGSAFGIIVCSLMSCRHGAFVTSDQTSAPVSPGTMIDARTEDGELQHFRIDSVDHDPRDRDGDVRLYGVSVLGPDARTWQRYCDPDSEGRSAAIPEIGRAH